eukprot:GHVR01135880.1.p1 GENE.GHVR01135880.1~~GHVR01135880.1.p1  ORF type:complete len:168 (+),score=3.90 GHVR01135880.1:357-860(+)
MSINMDTSMIENYTEEGLVNGMKGSNTKTEYCLNETPSFIDGYHTFYSWPFIQNMMAETVNTYKPYQDVNVNSSWIRSRVLQFRLIDLEYVVDHVLDDYPQYYANPILFHCQIMELLEGAINPINRNIVQDVMWQCKGYLTGVNDTDILIMDFMPTIKYTLELRIQS